MKKRNGSYFAIKGYCLIKEDTYGEKLLRYFKRLESTGEKINSQVEKRKFYYLSSYKNKMKRGDVRISYFYELYWALNFCINIKMISWSSKVR